MRNPFALFVLALLLFSSAPPSRAADPPFQTLGIPVRVGGLMGCIIGPDGKGGEALYFNFNQISGTLFLVQVNPDTGEAKQFDAPEGPGAWAFIAGPDDRIYLGTWSGALILRFDPAHPELGIVTVGKPSASEDYIWQFASAPDGWIYGCTYPGAKLIRFNPLDDRMEDLGRMHDTEMYARSVAIGPTGMVYAGIGTTKGDLVAYDPMKRTHRSILPAGLEGTKGWTTVTVSKRADGNVVAEYGTNLLALDGETATPAKTAADHPALAFQDGRVVTAFARGSFTIKDPKTGENVERRFDYAGAGDHIFMLGQGPGGTIYGSTAMPLEVFRFDPGAMRSEHLGAMPGGEVYSILPHGDKVYLCYYGGAVMNLYDPAKPWNWGSAPGSNPLSFGGVGDGHLRPRAMIDGPGGMIYIGSEPPYGELGGALAVWDPATNTNISNHRNLVRNQSIVALAWDRKTNLVFGGSGNFGGGGTKPVEKEAVLFAFDPSRREKVFEAALAPGADKYPALAAREGKVYAALGARLLVIDAASKSVTKTLELPGNQLDISLGFDSGGRLVGLTHKAVYVVDTGADEIVHKAEAPGGIKCGFALEGGWVYYASGAELKRCRLPIKK